MKFYMIQTLQTGHGKKIARIECLTMLSRGIRPKRIKDNYFPKHKQDEREDG